MSIKNVNLHYDVRQFCGAKSLYQKLIFRYMDTVENFRITFCHLFMARRKILVYEQNETISKFRF